jgi:hypothetical protein
MSVDRKKLEGAKTQEILAMSELNRLGAVAKFPLVVANLAQDLGLMLQLIRSGRDSADLSLSLDDLRYIEKQIRDEFFRTFGHDMIQEPSQEA